MKDLGYDFQPWWYGGYRIFRSDSRPLAKNQSDQPCNFPFADLFYMTNTSGGVDNRVVYLSQRARVLWRSGLSSHNVTNLQAYQFGPLKLWGPSDPEEHLTSLYGSDWSEAVYDAYDHSTSTFKPKIKYFPDQFWCATPQRKFVSLSLMTVYIRLRFGSFSRFNRGIQSYQGRVSFQKCQIFIRAEKPGRQLQVM